MALQSNNRNMLMRNERTMPAWVTEQSGRIGPKPPPPPPTQNGHSTPPQKQPTLPPKTTSAPEPDYEVIEFSNQQYSNTPLRPSSANSGSKTPDSKLKCTLCGSGNPWVMCEECSQQIFCASCDDMFHKHPKRKTHQRKTLEQSNPPLPPKLLPGQPGPTPPVAPPRRSKRGLMTPLMQRKDQVNTSSTASSGGTFRAVPSSPTPSMKNAFWQDRVGSLKRGLSMSILNRPLPETPKTPTTPSESSRCTTPKSAFDNIQRPPSVVLEKIKSKANATLDRMQLLQQRYRQQKEQMERDRSGSINDQNFTAFDQWSNISPSPSHFRSGSMSSGINSSHLDLTDDSSFNLFNQRQMAMQHHKAAVERANQLGQRGMSSSVFNLNQPSRKAPAMNNGWMSNPMHQAQSMAQLNCSNCNQNPQGPWGTPQHMHMAHDPWSNQLNSQQHLNRSNLSLNVGAGYMMPQQHHNGMYPPPVFMNQRGMMGQMYPQGYMGGMPVMNPGLVGMPPSVSRAASRAGSRMGSPALSRKSVTLRRKQRPNYRDDEGTDDEDSDEDDRRSLVSNRSALSRTRQRRMSSASQFQVEEDLDESSAHQRSRVRSQRRDSIAKSVHNDWAPGRKASVNNRSGDSGFNSPMKPTRIYSDLDSEGSGTRALVQAKIQQKLKEESLKQQKQSKDKRSSVSPVKHKQSAAVQTTVASSKAKEEKRVEKVEQKPATESESEQEEEEHEEAEDKQEEVSDEASATEESKEPQSEPQQNGHATPEPEAGATEDEDAVSLGPPPSTPDQEWECEFCTFVNEPNTKICIICCKTPCKPPKLVGKAVSPPKQVKTPTKEWKSGTTNNKEQPSNVKGKSKTTTKTPTPSSTSNSVNVSSSSSSKVVDSSETSETPSTTTKTLKKKESLEDIWATLDEDIQATASEVTRKAESSSQKQTSTKVSTGCGTSSKSASVERQIEVEVESRKSQAREVGTSPPPQTISTQTYEALPLRKSETKEESPQTNTKKPLQTLAHDSAMQPQNKIHDLKSFESEVLQNIHNISHIPSPYQYHQQQLNHHHQQQSFYAPHDRHQRYRSNNDLRMDDAMSLDFDSYNGMGRRQPSISELLLLQRTSSQMHSPLTGSSYDLSYRHNGMDNHKESDLYKYTTEELNAALKYCGPDMHPLVWLRDNWPKLIQTVQSLATKYGQERAENIIGTISQMEAREALRMHTGNIWQAVSECIEQRQRKYREISNRGNFSREDVVTALTAHQGNMDQALLDLSRNQLKPFLMRIWGSPGGVENESGAMILPSPSTNAPYAMDKDIHNFLSANASDCMQTSNASAAFPPNNQTPSPFDLPPASITNTYDLHTNQPDNTSIYSADSNKDFDQSSPTLQIDDSIFTNKGMLKDLETLIGNMEQNQQNQNEQVLRSIKDMLQNLKQDKSSIDDYDMESMRILTKSPITSQKHKKHQNQASLENNADGETDVKNFVWKHIQDIVPNLVQQVEMELMEDTMEEDKNTTDNDENQTEKDMQETVASPEEIIPPPPPPVDQDEFLMEEVIKPNLKNASIREELPPQYLYTAEIAPFQLAFDKALQREHKPEFVLESLRGALKRIFKMFKATEAPKQLDTEASSTEVEWSEPPLPIVPSNLSTSEAEVTLPEIPVETNMQATTYVGAENVRQAIEISAPSQASVLDKKEISQSTDIAKAFSSPPSPKVQNQTMSQPSTEIVIDTALRSSPESDNHARQETNEEPKQNMINFGTSEAVNHVGSPNPTNIDIIAQSPSPISSTGALKQATELQSKENVDEKEVRSSLNETVELPPTDTTSLMQTAHSSVTSQDDTQSSNEVLRDDSIIANEATPNPAPEATLEINSNQISNDQLQAESPIVELPREDVSQNVDSTSTTIKEESVTNEVPQDDQTSVVKETLSGIETEPQDIPSNILESIPQPSTSSVSEKTSNPIEKTINQKHTMANNQKKTSKIPVRRTASNKNLILNVQVNANTEVPQQESQKVETNTRSITPEIPDQHPMDENEDTDEEELYSLESDESITELDSRADDMVSPTDTESRLFDVQSPTSTNEMFLMIHNGMESGMEESTIVPSTSSSTVHSAISFASGLKSPTEFVPSGDPSKQNLSELVMDTQRLIKQMKDEIQIEDFESSTDEDDYTDDYSDIYDDDEMGEEEEYDEDGEEEEGDGDGEEEWEDDIDEEDEYADVIGDMTEDLQQSQANTPDPGHREEHNISALSNASQSSTHTQSLSSEHFVDENSTAQENLTNSSNPSTNSMAYVETENREPEIPVETAAELQLQIATGEEEDAVLQENSSTIVIGDIPNEPQIVQPIVKQSLPMATENEVELPLQIAAEDEEGAVEVPLENTNTIAIGDIPNEPQISQPSVKESLPISIENDVETENSLPELPTEIVLAPITQTLPLQTENAIPEVPVEVVLQTITEKSPSEIVINQTTNESFAPSTSDPSTSSPTSLNNDHEMPSTSGINNKQNANESVQDDDKLSSSKQTTKQNQKSTGSKKKTNEDGKTSGNKKSNTASKIPKPKDSSKDQKPKTNDNQNETKSKTITNEEAHTKETSTPTKAKTEPKKMLPTRSKSFSGPPTPIGITSVKTITQRFQTQPKSTKPQTLKAPTTVARKPSITEAINKLTKPSTSSQLPTTSSLFRARTQPRIPKKKYHETCFSDDDYETTSSEEEPEPLEIRQRKMSVPVFRAYPNLQEPEEVKTEELVEKFMKEELVNTIAEAQIAAALISMKFQQDVSLWAAKECSDLDHAVALLKQDCELCSGTYALNEIVSMLKCTHKCCKQCAKTYFTVQITERSINDCNCPFCKMPELDNQTEHEDDNLEYFSNLDIFLKSIVEPDVHELFQRKLRDRTLLKDPNFKWCVQCSSGFFARPKQKRLICPDCGSVTCAFCRKPWHKQHEGISCEKYLEWEQNNDPNVQDIGVQQHLEQNGIDCPKCKFRYSLARGGCMHFTCTQCKFEFCYGCAKPFMMGAKCTISPYCAKLGLHAHHPRNCLFYLRDKLPVQLQILLKNNNVEYDVDPIEVNDGTEASTSQKQPALCPIPIQKETPNGLVDTKCKNDVPDKHAGMCRTHYVEYLTAKVAKAKIDPLPIFDLTDCVQELRRRGIPLPDRGPWDTDEIYKNMCAEVIQKLIPLDSK